MNQIAIIGAGQLGSRHLQGLARLQLPCTVHVVDPSPKSLEVARQRFAETPPSPHVGELVSHTSPDTLPEALDYVIVATSADVRLAVLQSLLARHRVRHLLLEKVLFQRLGEYDTAARLIAQHSVRTWVNCPRRAFDIYAEVKTFLAGGGPLRHFDVTGGDWGLGCNSVHFIDLLAMMTGQPPEGVSTAGLDAALMPSKRAGFMEFTGRLQGRSGDATFELATTAGSAMRLLLTFRAETRSVVIDEAAGRAFFLDTTVAGPAGWQLREFRAPFMSELGTAIATDLLTRGDCVLTPFDESVRCHLPLVTALAAHAARAQGTPADFCPVT